MTSTKFTSGSGAQQQRRDIKSEVGKAWIEWVAVALLLFAIVRIVSYIGIGFDPHHDYYAFAPGLYVSEGLQPHKDFYTHYGPIDAAFKGVLITAFGKSLYSLRVSLLILNFVGLLSVCYLTRRTRYERIWLITLITIWAAFDPSSVAAGATSFWHHLAWSSDVAIFLICILCIISYWYWRLSRETIKLLNTPSCDNEIIKKAISLKRLHLNVDFSVATLGIAQGLVLSFIFFTKFTIGLSIITAILCSNIGIKYLITQKSSLSSDTTIIEIPSFNNRASLLYRSLVSKSVLTPVIGILIGALIVLALIGGPTYVKDYINDTFLGQYQSFTGGAGHRLLGRILPVITSPFAAASILISVLILIKLPRLPVVLLFATVLIIGISTKAFDFRSIATGSLSEPYYTHFINYAIAGLAILGSFLFITQSKFIINLPIDGAIYLGVVLPVGLLSLTQFYPVFDPFHVWWAVGTALPLASFIFAYTAQSRSIAWSYKILVISLSLCFLFTLLSFSVHAKNTAKYDFQEIQQPQSGETFLKHIRSADYKTVGILNDAKALVESKPKTIILESGPAAFVDLMNSSAARKSLASCRINPLAPIVAGQNLESYLLCLQKLNKSGWSVSLTNNNIQLTSKTRTVQDRPVIYWAVLEPVGKSPIPSNLKTNKREQKYNDLSYWSLD